MVTAKQFSLFCLSLGLGLLSLPGSSIPAFAAPLRPGAGSGQPLNEGRVRRPAAQQVAQKQKSRKTFVPPDLTLDRGIPTKGRSHNASRGGCEALQDGKGLALLVPEYVERTLNRRGKEIERRYAMGLSATPQPVFWAHVAVGEQVEEVSLEFVLQDAMGTDVHREMLAAPSQSGFVRIVPEAMPPLEAGVDYHWFLKQKSRCAGTDGLVRENGEAWVRYVEPSGVDQEDEETEFWYDALDGAAGDDGAFGELLEAIELGKLL